MKAVWLNRDNSPSSDGIVPDATIRSLSELTQTLTSL
jgi:FMN phosphatase YigB (HAD superfamily)